MKGIDNKLKNAVAANIGFSSNNTVFRVDDDECYNSVVMLGYMMVNLFVRAGIKKVSLSLISTKMK